MSKIDNFISMVDTAVLTLLKYAEFILLLFTFLQKI